jgi:hypothetical protein
MIGNDFSSNGELQITIREKKIIRQKRKKKIQAIQTNTGSINLIILNLLIIHLNLFGFFSAEDNYAYGTLYILLTKLYTFRCEALSGNI